MAEMPAEVRPGSRKGALELHDADDAKSVILQQSRPITLGPVTLQRLTVVENLAVSPNVEDVQQAKTVREENDRLSVIRQDPGHFGDPSRGILIMFEASQVDHPIETAIGKGKGERVGNQEASDGSRIVSPANRFLGEIDTNRAQPNARPEIDQAADAARNVQNALTRTRLGLLQSPAIKAILVDERERPVDPIVGGQRRHGFARLDLTGPKLDHEALGVRAITIIPVAFFNLLTN